MSHGRRTRDFLVMLPRIRRHADTHVRTRSFVAYGRSKVRSGRLQAILLTRCSMLSASSDASSRTEDRVYQVPAVYMIIRHSAKWNLELCVQLMSPAMCHYAHPV